MEKNMSIDDYRLLRESGNIGFYDYCEIITIFLFHKRERIAYNFFTLISFKEGEFKKYKNDVGELITINDDVSLGIKKYSVDLFEIDAQFEELLKRNSWSYEGKNLKIDELFARPKRFVPASGDPNGLEEPIPINQIINHCGLWECHYLLEFSPISSQSDIISNLLSAKELSKVCKAIYEKVHFDFNYLSDKIGSIIFEFNCSIIKYKPILLGRDCGIQLNLSFHQMINEKKDYLLQVIQEFDDMISRYEIKRNFRDEFIKIEPNDEINKLIVIDMETKLIVFMFQMDLGYKDDYVNCILPTNFITSTSQKSRTVTDKDGNENKITVNDFQALGGGEYSDNLATMRRQYQNSIQQLEKQKLLLTYPYGNEHERAMDDIRSIVNNNALRFDLEEICLWDPYLLSSDILNTVYYCQNPSLKIRAITSWQNVKVRCEERCENRREIETNDLDIFILNQKKWIESHSNNLGVILEFRIQHNQNGWGFHDRFLIINHNVNRPRVWSLGTSINSLGKGHHVIQAIQNPQVIVDAFQELWDSLSANECLIYKSEIET